MIRVRIYHTKQTHSYLINKKPFSNVQSHMYSLNVPYFTLLVRYSTEYRQKANAIEFTKSKEHTRCKK